MKPASGDIAKSTQAAPAMDTHQPSASKRTLLKAAAWVPPAIVALSLPRSSYAANVSGTDRSGKSKDNRDNDNHRDNDDRGNNGNHFGQLKK